MTKVVQVIYTEELRGDGTEQDLYRLVPQLWTFDGRLIAEAEYDKAKAYQDVMLSLKERS